MKKLLVTALMVLIAWGTFAQPIDASLIDMSKAEMSLAGPQSVYVTNIYYGDTRLSALLEYNGTTGATIKALYYDADKLLLDSFDFGQVELRLQGDSTLIISDMVLYGVGVSGRFSYDGVYTIDLDSWWQKETPVPYETQAKALAAQLETSQKRYEQEITATKNKYTADIAELEADNDDLTADVAELTSDVAKLEASVDNYESQIAALRRQSVMAAAGDNADRLLENMMFTGGVNKSMIDVSKADMSLAGPDSLYVSNIYYGDVRMSVILKYDGIAGATIYGPYYDDDKLLLDSFEMGYADIRAQGENTLIISDLVLYGQGITGRFEYDGRSTLNLKSWWESSTPTSLETQIAALEDKLDAANQELASTTSKYAAAIAVLEADNDDLKAEVAELEALRKQSVVAAVGDDGERLLENMMFSGGVDKSMINLAKAEMSLAGPNSIYVTNIYYGDVRMSVILKYNGTTGATIYGPYYDGDKLLLDSFEMGYADIRSQGDNSLVISDLVLYGQGITGRFEYDGLSTLNLTNWWESSTPASLETQIAALEDKLKLDASAIADLEETLNDLYARIDIGQKDYEDQIASLKRQLRSAGVAVAGAEPTRSVLSASAATRGTALGGTWNLGTSGLNQSDASQMFAKYAIPLNQSASQTLYSFTARAANASEFVGYGAHIFVSGDKSTLSWGLGNSYLVWITRDPKFYRNDNTYIQIYRSYDDVTMVQVASVATSENIARANDIAILYDKSAGDITVSVNGTEYISYDVADAIQSGNKVALRTLGGPVTFNNVAVKAK